MPSKHILNFWNWPEDNRVCLFNLTNQPLWQGDAWSWDCYEIIVIFGRKPHPCTLPRLHWIHTVGLAWMALSNHPWAEGKLITVSQSSLGNKSETGAPGNILLDNSVKIGSENPVYSCICENPVYVVLWVCLKVVGLWHGHSLEQQCVLVTLEWGNVKKAVTAGQPHPLLCTKVLSVQTH